MDDSQKKTYEAPVPRGWHHHLPKRVMLESLRSGKWFHVYKRKNGGREKRRRKYIIDLVPEIVICNRWEIRGNIGLILGRWQNFDESQIFNFTFRLEKFLPPSLPVKKLLNLWIKERIRVDSIYETKSSMTLNTPRKIWTKRKKSSKSESR